jgi:hypothetical protein
VLSLIPASLFATDVTSVSLNGEWKLSFWKQSEEVRSPEQMSSFAVKTIEANVPGNVEIDLEKAGLIQNPILGANVNLLRKYEGYQWCYSKSFVSRPLKKTRDANCFSAESTVLLKYG